jgi:hypothetical protein
MRFLVIFLIGMSVALQAGAQAQAPIPVKQKGLPVYEYNEGYPIYQDYYHKRRISIFKSEFDALKKRIDGIDSRVSGLQKKPVRSSQVRSPSSGKVKEMQANIALLEKQVGALIVENQNMMQMVQTLSSSLSLHSLILEGGQCHPVQIHR